MSRNLNPDPAPYSDAETALLTTQSAELWALWYAFDADDLAEAEARFDAANTQLDTKSL